MFISSLVKVPWKEQVTLKTDFTNQNILKI